ncbi:MAG: RcnB family protein [Pseudomonadota bacterium]
MRIYDYDYDYYGLGYPPRGYYYGRVGRDILLFAAATNAVANFIFAIDALNDNY